MARQLSPHEFQERFAAAGCRATPGQPEMRSGESWERFLASRKLTAIRNLSERMWEVDSVSGHTYEVSLHNRRDGEGMYLAGLRRRGLAGADHLMIPCPRGGFGLPA